MKPNIKSRTVYLGDNLPFLRGMNSSCVDLIYADPPFNTQKQFTAPIGSQAEGAGFLDLFSKEDIKDEWLEEFRQEKHELHSFLSGIKAIGNSYNYCYLVYMAIRFIECHRILKETGALYLHCDPTMSWGLRVMLDCIFGERNFHNEIVWCYRTGGASTRKWAAKHDVILMYAKKQNRYQHNALKTRSYIDQSAEQIERSYIKNAIKSGAEGGVKWWEYMSGQDLMRIHKDEKDKDTNAYFTLVNCRDWWTDIKTVGRFSAERTNYPTQKPLDLLIRIIKASSNKGDLVLDPFCGCVTTCVAAERLEREWVGIDVAKEAWNQIEKRLKKEVPPPLLRGEANFSTTPPKRGGDATRPQKYVYVISNPAYKGMYKVGVAADAEARLSSYQTADPKRRYKLEFKLRTPEYKTLEPHIHRHFDGDHEWVPGELGEIISAIKSYRP
ncbi:MAG: DNA methyltransferase [Gammaproteobacteria bacterium]